MHEWLFHKLKSSFHKQYTDITSYLTDRYLRIILDDADSQALLVCLINYLSMDCYYFTLTISRIFCGGAFLKLTITTIADRDFNSNFLLHLYHVFTLGNF